MGRLRSASSALVFPVYPIDGDYPIARYRYNGLGFRIMWQHDANADAQLTASDRYYFMYDERWRPVATFRNQDLEPKESFVFHAAGLGGMGDASYIDSVILRDRDNNGCGPTCIPWAQPSDGVLEETIYYCQNWRADVVVITDQAGKPVEWIRYSSYGEPTVYPAADVDRNGVVNQADYDQWEEFYNGMNNAVAVPEDFNFDGMTGQDPTDFEDFSTSFGANSGFTGRGRLSSGVGATSDYVGVGNRIGYAGYQWDPAIQAFHVRHRVYRPDTGSWTRRDPLGYVDGMSVYEYVGSRVIVNRDPLGLQAQPLPQPNPGPGLPSSPLRFPGDPGRSFPFPGSPGSAPPTTTPSPSIRPVTLPKLLPRGGPVGLVIWVGMCGFQVGKSMGEPLGDYLFPPQNLPPPNTPERLLRKCAKKHKEDVERCRTIYQTRKGYCSMLAFESARNACFRRESAWHASCHANAQHRLRECLKGNKLPDRIRKP